MKTPRSIWSLAFTLIEAMIVISILCIVALLFISQQTRQSRRVNRINCVNNQKQIVLAFKQWALDQADNEDSKFPMQRPLTNGGTMELVSSGLVWPHFQIMSNELNTPKVLVCPMDKDRDATPSFTSDLNHSTISYFIGVDAQDTLPSSFLIGDSDLTLNNTNLPRGLVTLATNPALGWTENRHVKQGNIGMADGSVQGFTPNRLREALRNTGFTTNRLVLP